MDPTRRTILNRLVDGPATGPELAEELSVSRAAVWKHVEALRDEGVAIRSTDDGYVLESIPEYGGAAIAADLPVDLHFDIVFERSVGSTNDLARELAEAGADETIVLADEQPGGRGRLGRNWVGPSGGIYMSLLLRPDRPPAEAPILTLVAAVAVARALEALDLEPSIKWPNDVLVEDRKVAGILTEMEGEADRVSWVIVGIGVNANVDRADLPSEATSLQEVLGAPVRRRDVVHHVIAEVDRLRNRPDETLDAWRDRAETIGQRVRVETPGGTVTGTATDVVHPGALVVETANGTRRVHAGDCEHLEDA